MISSKLTFIVSVFTAVLFIGCSSKLDIAPKDKIPKDQLSESDIDKLTIGLYARMEGLVFTYWFDFDARGENFQGGPGYSLNDPVNMSPSDPGLVGLWQSAYTTLSRVNFLIETVDDLGSQATAMQLKAKGEALFFRGLIYYYLVARWGGVPIVLRSTYDAVPRASELEVWNQVKVDLIAAESLVNGFSDRFYVSKPAVQALLAKVYLATGDKEQAIVYADKVLNEGHFQLAQNANAYASMFISGSTSSELIFALANNTSSSYRLFYQNVNDIDGSWLYAPTPTIYAHLYEDADGKGGDKRKVAVFSPTDPTRTIKFPNGREGQQWVPTANANSTPIVVLRIADIVLVKAEAQGANSGSETLEPYFATRYAAPPATASIKAMNPDQFLLTVLNERRREFYGEGQWWYDIKRTGKTELLTTLNGRNYLLYYPIPQNERDLAGYDQNEGY